MIMLGFIMHDLLYHDNPWIHHDTVKKIPILLNLVNLSFHHHTLALHEQTLAMTCHTFAFGIKLPNMNCFLYFFLKICIYRRKSPPFFKAPWPRLIVGSVGITFSLDTASRCHSSVAQLQLLRVAGIWATKQNPLTFHYTVFNSDPHDGISSPDNIYI